MITNIFNFFTIWIFILTIFSDISSKYFNLTFLSSIVLIIGSLFSFIYPKYFIIVIFNKKFIIDKTIKIIFADIILHGLVFLYNYNKFGFTLDNIDNSLILLLIYIYLIDFIILLRC
jgi:hypothetical protein